MIQIALLSLVGGFVLWGITGFTWIGLAYFPFWSSALVVAIAFWVNARRGRHDSAP